MKGIPADLRLRHLHYLSLVLREGYVERAALADGVSKAAVYQALKDLSKALGGQELLRRLDDGRHVPTERARAFCDWIAPLMAELPGRLEAARRATGGRVVLATTLPVVMRYGPGLVTGFRQRYPDLSLVLLDVGASLQGALAAVHHLEADLALIPGPALAAGDPSVEELPPFGSKRSRLATVTLPRQGAVPEKAQVKGLDCRLVGVCRYLLVLAPQHPLAKSPRDWDRHRLHLDDLVRHPMVAYPRGSDAQAVVDAVLQPYQPPVAVQTTNSEAALPYVLATGTYAVVPEATIAAHPNAPVRCYRLDSLPPERRPLLPLLVYTHAGVPLDPAVIDLRERLITRGRQVLLEIGQVMAPQYVGNLVDGDGSD